MWVNDGGIGVGVARGSGASALLMARGASAPLLPARRLPVRTIP